jgi:hypothetical protein
MRSKNRFNIEFFEFSFLVEACIPPTPIARSVFWHNVIDKHYHVLTQEERNKLFEWINTNSCFKDSLQKGNEDCLIFNARYDKLNQYKVKTDYKGKINTAEAFKYNSLYHISKFSSISPEYITEVIPSNPTL